MRSSGVWVLYDRPAGARPDELDVVVQAEAVGDALGALGTAAEIRPVGADLASLASELKAARPLCVFNLVESLDGQGRLIHAVPVLLERLGIPYTGCSARAQLLTSNKLLAKQLLMFAGIATPAPFLEIEPGPWIVKSVWEHASLGLDDDSVVGSSAAAEIRLGERRESLGGTWFAERYIEGREFNVALIETEDGPRALPVAEMEFVGFPHGKARIVDYAAKWQPESHTYRGTIRRFPLPCALTQRLEMIAMQCWTRFGLGGYARVDFRVDDTGAPWVLEINANPCLAPDAGFAAALGEARISFESAIGTLVRDALGRMSTGDTAHETASIHVQYSPHL